MNFQNSAVDDDARRGELRSFLMYMRSKVKPDQVGLPSAARRRVPGLRRQEVAELMDVSEDWYRYFESGRPISVSPRFLAKLSDVLQLEQQDTVMLYRLATPELYRTGAEAAPELPRCAVSSLTPITSPSEIEPARRQLSAAREAFLTKTDAQPNLVRPRILESWQRSRDLSVSAATMAVPPAWSSDDRIAEALEMNRRLMGAALPILGDLKLSFGMSYCAAITDNQGRILFEQADTPARAFIERVGIVPGADLSEKAVGTNGVGTVIADRRPLQITAAEHFAEGGQYFTCTGAPIRDPIDGTICGVLVVMSDYRFVRSALLPSVLRWALAIEEALASPLTLRVAVAV